MHPLFAAYLDNLWTRLNGGITFWTCFGLLGNLLFSSRFFVQWYVSEKQKQSVIPVSFWWLSLVGSVITSAYAIHLGSVPYILGVLPPTVIYARNLFLIAQGKKRLAEGPTVEDVGSAVEVAPAARRTATQAAPAEPAKARV